MKNLTAMFLALTLVCFTVSSAYAQDKPNILVIFGDDIGMWNISAYHQGMLGYNTPNIDRVAKEGALFTDYYAQQSCTAGRSAFITGQHPFRTGLLTVGLPGSPLGLQAEDPTLAELLKNHGYVTAQHGKNHLGDRNEFLPTVHGFDEFYGNLYHLNAEEEPEDPDYPKDPEFHKKFGPRGVLRTKATNKDDNTTDPRFGKVGMQTVEDTGPLTRKRMETADGEFMDATLDFMERANKDDKPFFIWHNTTRMHVWTHLKEESQGVTGFGLYADGMREFDDDIGTMLDKLDELGIAENTIVIISTDNGVQSFTYPDGGTIPFRGFKGTTWEGGFRVPAVVRWPGTVKPGTVINDIFAMEDWVPTLMAAAGEPDVKEKLLTGYEANGKTFKVHLDGYDQTELLSGKGPGKRKEIFYFDDQGSLNAIRYDRWKIHFTMMTDWINGQKQSGWPKVVDLRTDPFERAMEESDLYLRWYSDKMWTFVPAQAVTANFLETFKDYPQRQELPSFNINAVLDKLKGGHPAGN